MPARGKEACKDQGINHLCAGRRRSSATPSSSADVRRALGKQVGEENELKYTSSEMLRHRNGGSAATWSKAKAFLSEFPSKPRFPGTPMDLPAEWVRWACRLFLGPHHLQKEIWAGWPETWTWDPSQKWGLKIRTVSSKQRSSNETCHLLLG